VFVGWMWVECNLKVKIFYPKFLFVS